MKKISLALLHLLTVVIMAGLSSCNKPPATMPAPEVPLFANMDVYPVEIITSKPKTQLYFNQGLLLGYGFNHEEAARSFREAIRLDSSCAMCHWGLGYVLGPNYNAGMYEGNRKEAYWASHKAIPLSYNRPAWQKAIIKATALRYSKDSIPDREKLNLAYSEGLRKAYQEFPGNAEVGTLFAESLMNLHPWDLWQKDGTPQPWTPEILKTLNEVLAKFPNHPAANHLYIHAVEASQTPELGLKSAKILETRAPASGHLVHMPSHIYIRTGDYHQGSEINQKAIVIDSLYVAQCKTANTYPLTYYPHNIHFLAATAGLEGRGELSANAAFRLADKMHPDTIKGPGMGTMQHFYSIPYFILVKFGQWDQILALEAPIKELVYPQACLHYARGMAFAEKHEIDKAKAEWEMLDKILKDTLIDPITIWDINSGRHVLEIASLVLQADIKQLEGKPDMAIVLFENAVAKEDSLNYNEPPDWFFSVRHYLGNLLLKVGNYKEAEKVYREDLLIYPKNGYALNGLYLALDKQNKKEAGEVKSRFEMAWKYADVRLEGSMVKSLVVKQFRLERDLATGEYERFAYCGR